MRVKAAVILCFLFLFTGCANTHEPLDRAISIRNEILNSDSCSFVAEITADYGEKIYTFSMDCQTDKAGNLSFTVKDPATIAGITGKVSSAGGAITFDDKVLAFQTMADGQVSPVTAPWLFMHTLRSGYLKGCAETDSGLVISIDDSYAEETLHLEITTENDVPTFAEIFWQGRRMLTVKVENFTYL